MVGVAEDWTAASDTWRGCRIARSYEFDTALSTVESDGFFTSPFMEALGLSCRTAIDLEPSLATETAEVFSGLGVRFPTADSGGSGACLAALEAGLKGKIFIIPDVLLEGGVPCTVESGGLGPFVEALKVPYEASLGPELEPGRLNDLVVEPSG